MASVGTGRGYDDAVRAGGWFRAPFAVAMACGVLVGCSDGPPALTAEQTPASTTTSARPSPTALPPTELLLAVEAFRAEQASVISPELRAAARAARNAQGVAAKALSGYVAALAKNCGASAAAFQSSLGALRADVGTYDQLLDKAAAARVRLQAAALEVAAAAKRAGTSAPVSLTAVDKEYAALRTDAAARAAAAASLQARAAAARARCR